MNRETIIFYASWERAGQLLDNQARLQFYDAILAKAIRGEDLEIDDPTARACFMLVSPQIDANTQRYEAGARGGAPKGNQNAKKQPAVDLETTEKQPENNQTTTENQPNKNKNKNKNLNIIPPPPLDRAGGAIEEEGLVWTDFINFDQCTRIVEANVEADDLTRDRLAWYAAQPTEDLRRRVLDAWTANPNGTEFFQRIAEPAVRSGKIQPMPRQEWLAIAKVKALHLSPADERKIADAAEASNDPDIWERLQAAVAQVNAKIKAPGAFIVSRLKD